MLRRVGPWLAVFAVGTLAGLSVALLRSQTPVHTVATDRAANFAIATGALDNGVEGFFFLDFLTGQLRGAVLSNQTRNFQALYEANVYGDLLSFIQMKNTEIQAANAQARRSGGTPRPEIQVPQTPNYLIVTGMADIRRGPSVGVRPGQSIIYVAETNTGVVLAYAIPWSPESHSANRPFSSPLQLWAADQFSTVVLRTE